MDSSPRVHHRVLENGCGYNVLVTGLFCSTRNGAGSMSKVSYIFPFPFFLVPLSTGLGDFSTHIPRGIAKTWASTFLLYFSTCRNGVHYRLVGYAVNCRLVKVACR